MGNVWRLGVVLALAGGVVMAQEQVSAVGTKGRRMRLRSKCFGRVGRRELLERPMTMCRSCTAIRRLEMDRIRQWLCFLVAGITTW